MDDQAVAKARKRACKHAACVVVWAVVMFMLVWIVRTGFALVTGTSGDSDGFEGSYITLVFGAATVVFGMIYFVVGLTIVAELVLDLLAWLKPEDMGTANTQEKEQRTICQLCLQASATVVSMLMLTWAIYHGYKLAVQAPKGATHNCLTFVIGSITMAFGFVYFIIGISIIVESALHLFGRMQKDTIENDVHEDGMYDTLLPV